MGLERAEILHVAAEAEVDERTVRRALEGRTRSPAIRAAIARALRERGHEEDAKRVEGKDGMS